jgi:hypothetical protein
VGWDRPQGGNNGCLKGCLVIGGILAVLGIVGLVALGILGTQVAQQLEEDPEGFFGGECQLVSSLEVSEALGYEVQVFSLEGFADGTMGAILDKRLLADAPDCWVIGEDGTAARIAVRDGGGQAAYDAAAAEARDFTFREVDDIGDQAFCTTIDDAGSGGVLVRFGARVAYVSVVQQDFDAGNACVQARTIAGTLEP